MSIGGAARTSASYAVGAGGDHRVDRAGATVVEQDPPGHALVRLVGFDRHDPLVAEVHVDRPTTRSPRARNAS